MKNSRVKFETFEGRVVVASLMNHGKKYVGAAKCMPGDTFNLEIGQKLAEARANKKSAQADVRFWKAQKKNADFVISAVEKTLAHYKKVREKAVVEIAKNQTLIHEINKTLYPDKVK